ncbi:MAG: sulfotransferase domain-containing protein [Actinobacteria bacterium]|nr:MAG: sulfotransferase domain-containing protein [Actinomycetota bacterium]
MLPNLLIIGAQKCGTTSLHAYLDLHPDVHMAAEKELDFFIAEGAWRNGPDWYAARFRDAAPVRGEASPNYTAWPVWDGIPERAASVVPGARLVYLVRDPVERIESHYLQRRLQDGERGDIDAVIGDIDDPQNLFVARSRYATQLERWLEHFAQQQVLVVSAEELRDNREATVAAVLAHVGLHDPIEPELLAAEHHRSGDKAELAFAAARLRASPVGRALEAIPPRVRAPVTRRVRAALSQPVDRQELPPLLRERLCELLAPEADRLRALTGRRFEEWSL